MKIFLIASCLIMVPISGYAVKTCNLSANGQSYIAGSVVCNGQGKYIQCNETGWSFHSYAPASGCNAGDPLPIRGGKILDKQIKPREN